MTWPKFTHGGTVLEAHTDPVEFIANGIANKAKSLRLTNSRGAARADGNPL
jgi:hypothetical protein